MVPIYSHYKYPLDKVLCIIPIRNPNPFGCWSQEVLEWLVQSLGLRIQGLGFGLYSPRLPPDVDEEGPLGRPLGDLISSLVALIRDPIYQYCSKGFKGQPSPAAFVFRT